MKELMNWMKEEESGQGLVEYALIVGLISLVCIVAVTSAGSKLDSVWDKLNNKLDTIS